MKECDITKLSNEVINFGEELIDHIDFFEKYSLKKEYISSSIYSGTSGIILFLLDLYKLTKDSKYIEASVRLGLINIKLYENKNIKVISFLKGDLGNSYTLLQLYKCSKIKLFYEKASKIINECKDPQNKSFRDYSLFRGITGNIIVLLHFLSLKNDSWIIERLEQYIKELLCGIIGKNKGICWSEFEKNIQFPINFAFGSSGIDFIFLELFTLTENKQFWEIHKKITEYEDSYWNKRLMNWPDFRKEIETINDYNIHREAYLKSNFTFFTKPQDSLSWAYGAAGIGLSRLRALKSNNKDDKKIISNIVNKISLSYNQLASMNLYEGLSGIAIFLLEASEFENSLDLVENIFSQLLKNIKSRKNQNNRFNLFEGDLGIYYSSLQYLLKLNGVDSVNILNPYIQQKDSLSRELKLTNQKFDQTFVKNCKISNQFPITYKIVKTIENGKSHPTSKTFIKKVRHILSDYNFESPQIIPNIDDLYLNIIRDSYSYETILFKKLCSIKSNALIKIASLINKENKDRLLSFDNKKLGRQVLCKSPLITIYKTIYNWKDFETKINNSADKDFTLNLEFFESIKMNTEKMLIITKPVDHVDLIESIPINRIEYLIINIFRQPIRIIDGSIKFLGYFDIEDKKSKSKLTRLYFKYVKELIRQEILILFKTTLTKTIFYN